MLKSFNNNNNTVKIVPTQFLVSTVLPVLCSPFSPPSLDPEVNGFIQVLQ